MNFRRLRFAPITLALMSSGYANAVGIGDISIMSSIGQPLRAEVKILASAEDRLRESCFRLVPTPDAYDDIPTVTRARISLQSRAGQSFILITGSEPVSHPIMRLSLQAGCDIGLTREFMLLMPTPADLPIASDGAPVGALKPSPGDRTDASSVRSGPAIVGQWQATDGESLQSIAESLYPDDAGAQQRFIRAAVQVNPSLFSGNPDPASQPLRAGTTINMPSLRSAAAATRRVVTEGRKTAAPRQAPVVTEAKSKSPAAEPRSLADRPHPLLEKLRAQPAEADRLQVGVASTGAVAGGAPSTEGAEQARREQQLVAQLEDQLATYQALIDKINKMESYANDLREQLLRIETEVEAATVTADVQSRPAVASAPVATATARQEPTTLALESNVKPVDEGFTLPDWLAGLLAGAAAIGVLAFLSRRRAKTNTNLAPENPTLPMPDRSSSRDEIGLSSERDALITSPADASYSGSNVVPFAPRDDEGTIDVSEHESAMELAEIMLSFGRIKAAAQVLHDYVDANPKAAVQPWFKLLELYREAGMRQEFEAGAQRLNRLFNVSVMHWDGDSPESDSHSLERYGHIRDRLVASWGTTDCLEYLHRLLEDNRNGSRSGFPLPVLDEILLLTAILEEQKSAAQLEKVGRAA